MKQSIIFTCLMLIFALASNAQGETSMPMASIDIPQSTIEKFKSEPTEHQVYSKNFNVEDLVESFHLTKNSGFGIFQVFTTLKEAQKITITIKNEDGKVITSKSTKEVVWDFKPMFNISEQPSGKYFIQLRIGDAMVMQRFMIKY